MSDASERVASWVREHREAADREARGLTPRGVWLDADLPVSFAPDDVFQLEHDTRTGKYRMRVLARDDPRLREPEGNEISLPVSQPRPLIFGSPEHLALRQAMDSVPPVPDG